jgi:type IV secretion system protein TrbE
MMHLAEYRRKAAALADYLPWAALVAPGVVLNKDGSLQRTARFRGPDLDSATPAELVAVAARLNNAFRRLGSGWAIFVEAQRIPAQTIPTAAFPIRPRRWSMPSAARVRRGGRAFRVGYLLTFLWTCRPPRRPPRRDLALSRARPRRGIDPARCCAASSTAPTACSTSSTASCPNAAGSMMPRR